MQKQKITFKELDEKLDDISGDNLTASDKTKLESFKVTTKAAYEKSFILKQEKAIDIINEAWLDDEIPFNAQRIINLTQGMPTYLKEKVDNYVLGAAQAEALTEKGFKKIQLLMY